MERKGGSAISPTDVVRTFVMRINAHDNAGLTALMSPQYEFIDSLGNKLPYAMASEGWKHYFAMVPDYWIRLDQIVSESDVVIAVGQAGGTFVPAGGQVQPGNRWEAPAAWRAVVGDGKVVQWRVYCDNEPMREKMRATAAAE
jgi:ketosteroid isomerase-like protein